MEIKFNKYKDTIINFYTDLDIIKCLNSHIIGDIFMHEIIVKILQSKNKVSLFFDEFEKVNKDSKYESFIKMTKETSDWIEMCFSDSAEESREKFELFWKLLNIQIEDCKKSLVINEIVLKESFIIGLISNVQLSELEACLKRNGVENTKIRFLSTIFLKSANWYGKLLFIYYKQNTNFIPDFIPELKTNLDKLKTEEEKKHFIFQYGDSIIEKNKNVFKDVDDKIPRKSEFDKVTSDWTSFIKNNQEIDDAKKKFDIIFDTFKQQHVESINSLHFDETVLFQCKNFEFINDMEFSEMDTLLKKNDALNNCLNDAKIKFLLIMVNKGDWFEKLLHVYDVIHSDFIPCNMYNLNKELSKINNADDRKKYIFQCGNKELENFSKESLIDESMNKLELEFRKITCNWIESFVKNPQEAKDSRKKLEMMLDLFQIQHVDHIDSLYLDDSVLFQCRNLNYITNTEFDEMQAFLNESGSQNAKIKFLLMMSNKGDGWYGKILHIYDLVKSKFIHDYLPDLDKDLNQIQTTDERKDYIYAYANSLLEHNQNQLNKSGNDKSQQLQIDSIEFDSPKKIPMENEKMECFESELSSFVCTSKQSVNELLGFDGDLELCPITVDSSKETHKENEKMECIDGGTKELSSNVCTSKQSVNEFLGLDGDLELCPITDPKISNEKSSISEEKKSVNMVSINDSRNSMDSGLDKEETSSSDNDSPDDDKFFDELFGHYKDKSVEELLHFSPVSKDIEPAGSSPLEIRNYQQELAKHGIGGKNVLICSPTGSGKTIVAVKIVQEHLKKTENAKVAFLVHRIALVEQQYNQFVKYIDCKITRLTGASKSLGTPFVGHLKSFQLFILTSDILRNALEENSETKLESLDVFTLILFDECHNCDKKHPYNRIMNHYFKLKKSGLKAPQIIGLTASTGTNKAGTMDKALKRLFQLCANLDAYIVSTVKEFRKELEEVQSKPKENIITPELRSSDQFDAELQKLMQLCERMLLEMNVRGFFPKDPNTQAIFTIPEDRLHQKYLGFVGKLNTELYNVAKEENEGRKAVFAISNYLNAFVRALMVNHLFRAQDAVKLIKESLGLEKKIPTMCKVERILRKRLKAISEYEKQEFSENPCLKSLKDEIMKQIKENAASRIIVFVKERNYTKILKSIFSEEKSDIKCEIVVGNAISAEHGGLTQNELEEILGRFRRGEVSVLFATTVAEEGLDIQKCNLVIRYGHVTNETAMVQSRGRARAADSKYIVIVPNKLQWQVHKENINKYRETMMYRAIEKFQEMSEDQIKHEIQQCQCERELQETCEKLKSPNSKLSTSSVWYFNCKKCSENICKSTDVRVAERAHYMVINQECFQYMKAVMTANQTRQILCKKCSNILGNCQNYKGRLVPSIKIDSFSLVCEETGLVPRSFKKWRDVPFTIAEFSVTELLNLKPNNSFAV